MWLPRGRKKKWVGWGVWVGRCKLLHLEWISNEVVLYSTGKLCPISWDKAWWTIVKKNVYMIGLLHSTAEIDTTLNQLYLKKLAKVKE